MQTKSYYHIYGFKVASDISLPGLPIHDCEPDIIIQYGTVPVRIDFTDKTNYMYTADRFYFFIHDLAHFFIENGKTITIEPMAGSDIGIIREYVLGIAFSVVLFQRKMIPLHGSAIVMNDRCIIFTGKSGAGKSSVCKALVNDGCKFLSDDMSVIVLDGETPMVQPAYPQMKLCKDAAQMLVNDDDMLQRTSGLDGKLYIRERESFSCSSIPLAAIFELISVEDCKLNYQELAGTEKLKRFIENIFFCYFLHKAGMDDKMFQDCLSVVKAVPYYKIERPAGVYTVRQQIDMVKSLLP